MYELTCSVCRKRVVCVAEIMFHLLF